MGLQCASSSGEWLGSCCLLQESEQKQTPVNPTAGEVTLPAPYREQHPRQTLTRMQEHGDIMGSGCECSIIVSWWLVPEEPMEALILQWRLWQEFRVSVSPDQSQGEKPSLLLWYHHMLPVILAVEVVNPQSQTSQCGQETARAIYILPWQKGDIGVAQVVELLGRFIVTTVTSMSTTFSITLCAFSSYFRKNIFILNQDTLDSSCFSK